MKVLMDWLKKQEEIHIKEIFAYTLIVFVSLLTVYMVSVSMLVAGKPWDEGMTGNVLSWIQVISLGVMILQLEKIREDTEKIRAGKKK